MTSVSAIAVLEGRVAALGANPEEVRVAAPDAAEVFDFPGAKLLPGFWDTHVHVERVGLVAEGCELYTAGSIAEIQEGLAGYAAANHDRDVIFGRAGCLHPAMLAEGRLPTRQDLDEAVGGRPVVFHDVDKAFANSSALKAAGITKGSPDPEGGRLDRDTGGEPNGVCWFRGGQGLFNKLIALRPTFGPEEYAENYRKGCLQLASKGITTVIQAYAKNDQIGAIGELDADGRLPCRSIVQPAGVRGNDYQEFLETPYEFGQQLGPLSHVGPFKLLYDLFIMHRSARVSQHYVGQPENFGGYNTTPEELVERIHGAMTRGFPVGVHITGDEGLDEAVAAIAAETKAFGSSAPEGSFLIHGYFASPDAPKRMADLGLGLAAQPIFHYAWADQVEEFVGNRRACDFYPYDRYLDAGVTVGGGSDAAVAWYDPLYGIYAATTRKSASGKVWGEEHAVDADTAVRFFTEDSARLVPWTGLSGKLEVGEPADFVVLDRDPRDGDAGDVRQIKVLATYVAGREVYRAEA